MNPSARIVLILVALAVVGCGAAPAAAHAFLEGAYPASEAALPAPPTQITLRFSEPLVAAESSIRLLDERGNPISERTVTLGADPKVAVVDVPALAPGVYIVQWSALSALDGHQESGSYWFRVTTGPGEAGGGASGAAVREPGQAVNAAEAAAKGLGFLSALLVFGMHAVRLLTRAETRRRDLAVLAFAALVQTGYWALVWAGQTRPLLAGLGVGPRFLYAGRAMTVLFAAYLAYLLSGSGVRKAPDGAEPRGSWVGLGAGAAALAAFALTGHSAGSPSAPLSAIVFDWIHMVAAGIWTGAIALLLLRSGRRSISSNGRFMLRLTGIVVAGAAVLALTGLLNAELRGVEVRGLTRTGYGLALAWKLAFIALMAMLGAFHAFVVNPWRQKGASRRLWRAAVSAEALALLLVLAATAVLTLSPPPAAGEGEAARGRGLTLSTHAGPTLIETTLTPNLPGENELTIRLTDGASPPRRATVHLLPVGVVAELAPVRGEPGVFAGELSIPSGDGAPASYSLQVTLTGEDGEERSAEYPRWPVPAPGGIELLRKADEAMSLLSTVRVFETLSDGENTVDKIWWYKAPDEVLAEVVGGTSKMIVIGADRWTTTDGETWEHDELGEPLDVPGFAYADQATEVEILGREELGDAETFVVSFRFEDGSYRFVAWIDAETYRLARLTMDGPHHFMTWTFDGFDREIHIEPPRQDQPPVQG